MNLQIVFVRRLFIPLKLEKRVGNIHEILKIFLNFARKCKRDTS